MVAELVYARDSKSRSLTGLWVQVPPMAPFVASLREAPHGKPNSMFSTLSAFLQRHDLRCPPEQRMLDVVSEAGELSKEFLQESAYGKKPVTVTPAMNEEYGDLLFSVLALADALEIDPTAALTAAIAQYEKRIAEKGHAGSGRP